jgi:hypothetical protein
MRSSYFAVFLAALFPCAVGRCETVVPENLVPPAEAKLSFIGHASGVQIYGCQASATGAPYVWVFSAPEANLTDDANKPIATHFAGPTWQSTDGSQVKGKAIAQAVPDPESIPWLLISAIEHKGSGMMSSITYIQRLHTKGGKAPASGCDASAAGEKRRVPYNADYYFYSTK